MMRNCVCGKHIPHNRQLCASCVSEYSADSANWPAWLIDWMCSYQKELNTERDCHDLSIDVDEGEVVVNPLFKLNGCREQTHLYQKQKI